jgi:hypothetical protein
MFNKTLIAGANNVIRLENKSIYKVLYIFNNYYIDEYYQTECVYTNGYDIMDIDKFIFKFMRTYKGDHKIDLFCTMLDYEIYDKQLFNYSKRYKYSDNMKKLFNYNLIQNKKKVKINPKFPSIRFHYSDILNKLKYHPLLYNYIYNYVQNTLNNKGLTNMNLNNLYNIFNEFFINLKKNTTINKIKNKYSNNNIKKKINYIFNNYVIKNGNKISKQIKNAIQLITKNDLTELKITVDTLAQNIQQLLIIISDLFFLRRFLDKNYIKNGILYTDTMGLSNIVYILVKYFGFDITNIYYGNIEQTTSIIKNLTLDNYMIQLIKLFTYHEQTGNINQCIDLGLFPDNFE